MKHFHVFFKEEEDPLTVSCSWFSPVKMPQPGSNELCHWFEFYDTYLGERDIFVQYSEVAAIIPADYDPAEPGFHVYLRGRNDPLTVKAHKLKVSALIERLSFLSQTLPDVPGSFKEIEDVYLAWPEVLAVVPEHVTEGEEGEAQGEVSSRGEKLPPPGRGRARGSK